MQGSVSSVLRSTASKSLSYVCRRVPRAKPKCLKNITLIDWDGDMYQILPLNFSEIYFNKSIPVM